MIGSDGNVDNANEFMNADHEAMGVDITENHCCYPHGCMGEGPDEGSEPIPAGNVWDAFIAD